jgi:hypothetical protein
VKEPSHLHRILKRKMIRDQLDHTFDYPLTLVVAAMGKGFSRGDTSRLCVAEYRE